MRPLSVPHVERYLQHLRGLPFVKKAELHLRPRPKTTAGVDGTLSIKTPHSTHHFDLEIKRSPTTYAAIDAVIGRREPGRAAKTPRALMLFAPHIGRPLAEYLVGKSVDFVDEAGNCHVRLGASFVALIQGRTAVPRAAMGRGIGDALEALRVYRESGFQVAGMFPVTTLPERHVVVEYYCTLVRGAPPTSPATPTQP